MRLKLRMLTLLVFVIVLFSVPMVYAQPTEVDFNALLSRLGPRSGQDLIYDILLYLIFGLALVTMFLVPDKQLLSTMLMVVVMFFALLAKVELFVPTDFAIFVLNVGMWVIPWIVAGMVRSPSRRYDNKMPKALVPAIITGFLGAGYFFLFWANKQAGSFG